MRPYVKKSKPVELKHMTDCLQSCIYTAWWSWTQLYLFRLSLLVFHCRWHFPNIGRILIDCHMNKAPLSFFQQLGHTLATHTRKQHYPTENTEGMVYVWALFSSFIRAVEINVVAVIGSSALSKCHFCLDVKCRRTHQWSTEFSKDLWEASPLQWPSTCHLGKRKELWWFFYEKREKWRITAQYDSCSGSFNSSMLSCFKADCVCIDSPWSDYVVLSVLLGVQQDYHTPTRGRMWSKFSICLSLQKYLIGSKNSCLIRIPCSEVILWCKWKISIAALFDVFLYLFIQGVEKWEMQTLFKHIFRSTNEQLNSLFTVHSCDIAYRRVLNKCHDLTTFKLWRNTGNHTELLLIAANTSRSGHSLLISVDM